jgi:hypothetical protein
MTSEVTVKDRRGRLLDHSKRVYSIIVGLAIADACRTLFPFDFSHGLSNSLVLFLTFVVTVVPIYQGFDRSLDIKYYETSLDAPLNPGAYTWDVAMLLVTAIFFVGMAESLRTNGTPTPAAFYFWLGLMLVFDCGVLLIDYAKSPVKETLRPHYRIWGAINLALGIVAIYASFGVAAQEAVGPATGAQWLFLLLAVVRSGIDYSRSMRFRFPQ